MSALFGTTTSTGATFNNKANDAELSEPPTDSISSLAFSTGTTGGNFLAVGSWDNAVRIYQVESENEIRTQGKAMYNHEGPVLDVCWSKDGTKLLSAGGDNAARMYDLQTGTPMQVAAHDAAVKCVRWVDAQGGILATGSLDKTVKYWDLRSNNPVATVPLRERCYSMDVVYPLMVVATAERKIQIYNLTAPTTLYREQDSPLKWQTRIVSCFPTADGYAIGSIEGRVAIQYVEENKSAHNFSFKCHRKDQAPNAKDHQLVHSVNDISFHPIQHTFSTVGSDGTVNFWDKDARTRLKSFDPAPGSIPCSAFDREGKLFAYAVSYDWSKGHMGMTPGYPNKVMLHRCMDEEVKKRPATKK